MMPSSRRVRIVLLALIVGICFLLYFSNDSSSQEFYSRTVTALEKKKTGGDVDSKQDTSDLVKDRGAANDVRVQKPLSNDGEKSRPHSQIEVPEKLPSGKAISGKAPSDNRPPEDQMDGDKTVAGRKIMKHKEKPLQRPEKAAPSTTGKPGAEKATDSMTKDGKSETSEEHEVEIEINTILKKGPIIIFSKSYCPFSTKAKHILLEKYAIVPAPYVVEIDQHPLGSKLQATLEKMTGRRTVPNILINGKSIGGGDDVQELDEKATLVDKIKSMGGKRIMEVKIKEEKQ